MRAPVLAAAFVAALCNVEPVSAQIEMGPAVLRSGEDWTPALRVRARVERRSMNLLADRPSERAVSLQLHAPVAWHARRNPETLSAVAELGWEKSLLRTESGLEIREDDVVDPGFLAVRGALELEAPQSFDTGTGSFGVVAEYAHRTRAIFYIPNLRVALTGTGCLSCTPDDDAAVFGRADATAGMTVPFSFDVFPAWLAPLELRLGARGFRTFGQPDESRGEVHDRGVGGNATAAWRRTRPDGWWEVFLRWQDGRLPLAEAGARAWTVGALWSF